MRTTFQDLTHGQVICDAHRKTLGKDPARGQVSVEAYHEWIRLVAAFTVHSLESWAWTAASVYYLLGLWSRLVSSLPYLKGEAPSLLETYVPKITRAYLTSRCAPGSLKRGL